jgi:hypothetical protein
LQRHTTAALSDLADASAWLLLSITCCVNGHEAGKLSLHGS